MTDLNHLRQAISAVDRDILKQIAKRKQLTEQVAHYKMQHQLPVRDLPREEHLFTNLIEQANQLQLSSQFVTQLFRLIIEDSVRAQRHWLQQHHASHNEASSAPIRVAFLGNKGSYSNIAVSRYFEASSQPVTEIGCPSFRQIVDTVEQRQADYALLPIENTSSGSINEVYDVLQQTSLSIIGELAIEVDHGILVKKHCELTEITTLYGHPQPLAQCSHFLEKYPHLKFEFVDSSSKAMQIVSESTDATIAAIGSETGGKMYGLTSIHGHIANQQENYTRFIVVARSPIDVSTQIPAKTTFIMATGQHPGALAGALQTLADRGINMTRLESRPVQGNPWQELFYVDVSTHVDSLEMQQALADLTRSTRFIKVLGCYPRADIKQCQVPSQVLATQPVQAIQDRPTVISRHLNAPLSSREHKPTLTTVTIGNRTLGEGHFMVMAGPDTIEDQDQLNQCAEQLTNRGAHLLHGACFKSSSNPYDYRGLGMAGLPLLEETARQWQIPVMTEVTHIDHLREIAAHVDVLQIGAANMQNYPLLKAAGNTTRPIVLERGSVASLDEWLEAADYILAQGNQQVILCERGIRTADHQTRSIIDLSAIALLRGKTHLPIMLNPCDGVTQACDIAPLAIAARQLGADGVMLNIHPHPTQAKVAPNQSLDFHQFEQLMVQLYQNH
ncbi:prephenate dehydratase [Celerinatantimonas sp. YJH-8]|uniref:prephenate dehydratase n=1 Tax=Celerinatantimonas sp. YJH-8 TaxID=3228714 RepID=UPI0038C281DE